jgi:hypothetical protein
VAVDLGRCNNRIGQKFAVGCGHGATSADIARGALMAPQYPTMPGSNQGQPAQNGMGTAALVMGILQFFCLGIIGSILAVIFGRIGMTKAEQGLANNGGVAKAGFILGLIGVALFAIGIVLWIILVIAAGTSSN